MSKSNVFHHFATKESLYLAVLKNAGKRMTAAGKESPEAQESSLEGLRLRFANQLSRLLDDQQATRLVLRELLDHGSQHSKELAEEIYASAFARLVASVRSAQASGELSATVDPGLIAFLLLAANVFSVQARGLFAHIPDAAFTLDPEAYAAAVFDVVVRGVASR